MISELKSLICRFFPLRKVCRTHSFNSPLTRQVDRVVAAAPPDERDVEEEELTKSRV